MTSCGIFPSGDFRPGSPTKATTGDGEKQADDTWAYGATGDGEKQADDTWAYGATGDGEKQAAV